MTKLYKISLWFAVALVLPLLPACAQEEEPLDEAQAALYDDADDMDLPSSGTIREGTVGNYLSGQFARSSGDIEGAIRYLNRAHQNDLHNGEIIKQLQGLLLVNGDIEEAVQLAKNTSQPEHATSLNSLLLSLDAIKRDKLQEASVILKDAASVSVGQLWWPLVVAWLDVGQKKIKQAVKFEGMPADAGYASALANYHLALINNQAGFIPEATENFKHSVSDLNNPPARVMMMMAKFYDQHGKPKILEPLVTAWRKDNPDSMVVAEDIRTIFTPKDGIAEVLFTMGSVVQSAGAPQDAIIYLQMARYVKPKFPLVTVSLGDAYTDMQQYEKANAIYATVDDKSPFYARAQLRMALNDNQNGDIESALNAFDALARKLPKNYEALVAKGDLLRSQQRFIEAVAVYNEALSRIPMIESYHWPIFFARGVCLERQNKWDMAELDLYRALNLKPDQPDILNYLGYSWIMQGKRLEEARTLIEKASKQRPNDPQIADSMGWALYSLEEYKEAVPYLERALELLPSDPTINDHLGDVYWRLGRRTEARFQWERSLTFTPAEEEAKIIQKKLKEGLAAIPVKKKPPVVAESVRPDISVR